MKELRLAAVPLFSGRDPQENLIKIAHYAKEAAGSRCNMYQRYEDTSKAYLQEFVRNYRDRAQKNGRLVILE